MQQLRLDRAACVSHWYRLGYPGSRVELLPSLGGMASNDPIHRHPSGSESWIRARLRSIMTSSLSSKTKRRRFLFSRVVSLSPAVCSVHVCSAPFFFLFFFFFRIWGLSPALSKPTNNKQHKLWCISPSAINRTVFVGRSAQRDRRQGQDHVPNEL